MCVRLCGPFPMSENLRFPEWAKEKERENIMEKRLFTSESVTEGHPDKMCDAISDAILDALMEKDPMSRVACETATTTGLVMVMGEITKIGRASCREGGEIGTGG